jgi:uncharacterized protein (DUF2336 family)
MNAEEKSRVRLGASATTRPDILMRLAADPSVTVRASLAMNPALPDNVSAVLAKDKDARVRSILNRKLAPLTPGLSPPARQQIQQDALENLTNLVAEAALRVRKTIAEAVRDMADGPRQIILRLAEDPDIMVSEPVILFSPMLTPEDLVALIASRPPPSTVHAVARRPRITDPVSDAIVEAGDSSAIGALLRNQTAQIREATLDALAVQSEDHPDWQEPLVRRPNLPPRAARALSEIVTGHLLEVLAVREDLDPGLARDLRAALVRSAGPPARGTAGGGTAGTVLTAALGHASALKAAGRLDDQAIIDSLRRNATVQATAMLAVKAGVPTPVIDRACGLRSAKAVVSLAWKAGLTMGTAVALQVTLAGLSAEAAIKPGPGGGFPLTPEEMRWQLGFLGIGEGGLRSWTPPRLKA